VTRVFVYGSLRQGLQNHRLLEGAAFLGVGWTEEGYTMVSLGRYPGVARGGHTSVWGELYDVDDGTLAALDLLEGNARYYTREQVKVYVGNRWEKAWIYLLPLRKILRLIPDEVVEAGDWVWYVNRDARAAGYTDSGEEEGS
jgi:gamma-glutamylcyclotransferase (GGCT)/AIG2-like uncharacterized protein YtfP